MRQLLGQPLIVRRDGTTVRLFTRRGYDWTDRYPAIAAAAAKLRARSFTIDGEAVVAGGNCIAVFDALHRRRRSVVEPRAACLAAGVSVDSGDTMHLPRSGHRSAKIADDRHSLRFEGCDVGFGEQGGKVSS
jgi:ATP dependent DNA ligase domain